MPDDFINSSWVVKNACCVLLLTALVSAGCKKPQQKTLFELMDNTGINFVNEVHDTKEENCFQFRNFYNGGGVALGDLNNDSLPDVVFTSNLGSNKIYINKGNFRFEDITASSGFDQKGQWGTGVTLVDINHDGWLDIYICSSGHIATGNRKNQLYINNGKKGEVSFTESAAKYGLDITGYCTQAAFFDYDLDGDLDCFLINNTPIPFGTLNYAGMRDSSEAAWNIPDQYKGGSNHLYKNNNDHFEEVTKEAGLHSSLLSFGLGLSVADINGDGYPDVYVGNDFLERDYLYINQKDGTFKDELEEWVQHLSMSSMGTDIADINNDGYPDIYTTDMFPDDDYRLKTTGTIDNYDLYRSKIKAGFYHQYVRNCLQLNNRQSNFIDIANYSGVSATDWSWGLVMFDADNDGFNDIYVCNGINRDLSNLDFLDFFSGDIYKGMLSSNNREAITDSLLKTIPKTPLLNKVYRNLGNLKFQDNGEAWGFTQPSFSNTVAYADLDNDGDLDLVVNNENQEAFVYKNNSDNLTKHNYISVNLKGSGKNKQAIGANIKVYAGGQVFYREVQPVRGFQSCVDDKQLIGLGNINQIDSMVIMWPDLSCATYLQPALNKQYFLSETDSKKNDTIAVDTLKDQFILTLVKNNFDRHAEDDYVDFYYERNIPQLLSREGPKAAAGDVNNDGLDDVFIGGASGQPGQLYIQTSAGIFTKKTEKAFEEFAGFEDVAVLFFDCDKDGDLDLFVGPGGNNQAAASREMQLRLYKNDGKGNYTLDAAAFPMNAVNIAVATADDFDKDGDLDLFVGGRSVPKTYGLSPRSYLFVNDGNGHFTDVAATKNKDIAAIGMVTSAAFADMDGDHKNELIICGEWMTPQVFKFNAGHFQGVKTNLDSMFGWWQTVVVADVDGNGTNDLVLGNIGENFYLHPTTDQPAKIWINDFDKNGSVDKIITRSINGKDMPVFLKHEMEEQIPSLKKQSLLHKDYAIKTIQDLFTPAQIQSCIVKQFNYTSSCVAINNGNGQFAIKPLPQQVQLSSVNAIAITDINGDGIKDLVTAGNQFGFLPLFGRLDGNFGTTLLNDGKGNFMFKEAAQKGLTVKGETRDIALIKSLNKDFLLFLRNDDYPMLYEINKKK